MAVDSYRYVDFARRQIMKAWAARQEPGEIPFTPPRRLVRECTVALVSTAGIARNDGRPFDQEGERRSAQSRVSSIAPAMAPAAQMLTSPRRAPRRCIS